ncbi:MAG: TonB-dependent receptor [Dysgonamonadaceae bacterium]|nr:TonB-dependent receptor [Dysgonamonadaceae bacterium]
MLSFILSLLSASVWAQQSATVGGVVTDENYETLSGVSVSETGTSNGVITDVDGRYTIVLKSDKSSLTFRYMGYQAQTSAVNGQSKIDVQMTPESQLLDEVVVVGYGVQKKVNLTGAVSSINFSEQAGSRPIVNTSSALAGLAAGMNVRQGSGQPGSDGATIRVRGNGTFNTNSPLVLVDGIEWSMDDVNPNDIENISILKDAASTAIYGTRAANGVILVTTKNGKGKSKITYSYQGIVQNPYNRLSFVSDYARYMELVNEACDNVSTTRIFSETNIERWRAASLDPTGLNEYGVPNRVAYPNTNWFDAIFDTGFSQEHNISASGSTDKVNYLISAGYLDNQGIMNKYNLDSGTQKFNFRTNLEGKLLNWLTVGTRIFGQKQDYGMANISNGFNYLYQTTPGVYPGEPNFWGRPALSGEESSNANNLFGQMAGGTGFNTTYRLNASAWLIVSPFKGFSVEGTFNYSPVFTDRSSYSRPNGYWDYVSDTRYSESALENAGITNNTALNYRRNMELLARYNLNIKQEHEIGVLLGHSVSDYYSKGFSVTKKGATDWSLHDLSTYGELTSSGNTVPAKWALLSFFGRVNYSYNSRYLFEANLRADGSSRFGSETRWGYFPSFSGGWRVSEEAFMKDWETPLSYLKLRLSYGQTGNNSTGDYDWQANYATGNVVVDGLVGKGLVQKKISNSLLQWESTATTDIGVDFGLFKNRLTGELDLYDKYTTQILYAPELYLTMGVISASRENAGEVRNQGVELTLNWNDKIGKHFRYNIGFNASYNKNKVVKFKGELQKYWNYDASGNKTTFVNNFNNVAEGGFGGYLCESRQLGETYIRQVYRGSGEGYTGGAVDIHAGPKDGMIRTEKDLNWVRTMIASGYSFGGMTTISKDQLWYGDLLYEDSNGDKDYGNANDQEFSGHTNTPTCNFGLNLGASYRDFDFSMLWAASVGYYLLWNSDYYNSTLATHGYGIIQHIADDHYFYDPNNPDDPRTNINGKYPRLTYGTTYNNRVLSDFYEYKGDYLKLKNIQLGYTLPAKISGKLFVGRLRTYVSMENILTITSYPGLDPEIGTAIGYPLMRQISFGAQITF